MTTRTEQVDVAIVGGGLAGLATAVALHKVRPDAKIKVYERRKALPGYESPPAADTDQQGSSSSKKDTKSSKQQGDSSTANADQMVDDLEAGAVRVGGGVRLEMNGLKAIAAISRELAGRVMSEGLYAHKVLLHDTIGGAVVSRLHEPPHPSSPSPRQPALMIGWSELEAALLARLPPGTVEWESVATAYTNTSHGVTLNLLVPSLDDAPVTSHMLSTAMTHALDTELHAHMKQQREAQQQEEGVGAEEGVPRSPFSNSAAAAGGGPTGGSPFSGTGPAPAAGHVAPAGVLTAHRLERLTVTSKLLVAADGPSSVLRQQALGDGAPAFEGLVRWVGRLPGDMLSTIPVDQEAWWMGGGMTFASHPLSDGDVAWEAQVSSTRLAELGLQWDTQTQAIIRTPPSNTQQDSNPASSSSSGAGNRTDQLLPVAATAHAAAAPAGQHTDGFEGFHAGSSSSSGGREAKRNGRAAVPADAPAGDEGEAATVAPAAASVATLAAAAALAQAVASAPTTPRSAATASNHTTPRAAAAAAAAANGPVNGSSSSSTAVRHVKISPEQPTTVTYDAATDSSSSSAQPLRDPKSLLMELFADFPNACLDMIQTSDESTILEGPVLTRAARDMPACMGRGSVVVLGEAAHPVRPSGQEASQAFEDAAELGAAVMRVGLSREALRRFELIRRPRWTHAMQVSQAFGSVTNLGGVALHQGLLDYTAQVYHMSFTPLRAAVTLPHAPHKPRRNPLLHWAGVALLTYGTVAAAGLAHRHLAHKGQSPLGQIRDPVGQAVVGAVDAVGQSAVVLGRTAKGAVQEAAGAVQDAVQDPKQTAAAIKGAAQKGVSATIEGSGTAAAAIGRGVGRVGRATQSALGGGDEAGGVSSEAVVHGEVPPRRRKNVFVRVRDGAVKRTMQVGVLLSKPFTAVLRHQVRGSVAETLGAF